MEETQEFLSMDIPAVNICWLSHLPPSDLQHSDKARREEIQKFFLERSWDSIDTEEQQPELTAPTKVCWMCKAGSLEYPKLKTSPRTRFSISVENNQGIRRFCDINFKSSFLSIKATIRSCIQVFFVVVKKPSAPRKMLFSHHVEFLLAPRTTLVEKLHKKHADWIVN